MSKPKDRRENPLPKVFTAEETKTAYLCGCKQTGNPAFCDGTHATLD